jgi:phosphodiester glycosidase
MLASLFLSAPLATNAPPAHRAPAASWRVLQPGVEYAEFEIDSMSHGDRRLRVVRVFPSKAVLRAALASEHDRRKRTAREWCHDEDLAVAINIGMFRDDQVSNVGYLRSGNHINNGHWNEYKSALGLRPVRGDLPAARWLDLDSIDPAPLRDFSLVVQNLRLIRGDRRGVWAPSHRRWSEAALAIDRQGTLLFLFSRAPLTMAEFNRAALLLPLGIVRAMHLEGGPEASLSIHAGGLDVDLCGSYETGFQEDDQNSEQWPIPNVLGVARAK